MCRVPSLSLSLSTSKRRHFALPNQALSLLSLKGLRPENSDPQTKNKAVLSLKAAALDVFSLAVPAKVQRSEQEASGLKRTIALLARVFSKNYNMEVLPSPQGGWACGINPEIGNEVERYITGERANFDDIPKEKFKPTQIFYDVKDIYSAPKDQVYGVLRHEVGHALHSDYPLFFQGQRLAREEGHLPTTWMGIHNALEDPWVNNLEIRDSELVRQQMTHLYAAHFPEIEANINSQPLTHQLGLNINYYWVTGKNIPTLTDQKVLDTFNTIRPHVDAFFKGATAQENYDNLLANIWPHIKRLEGEAQNNEAAKSFAKSQASKGRASSSGSSQEAQPSSSSGSPTGDGPYSDLSLPRNPFNSPRSSQPQKKLPWYKRLFRRKKPQQNTAEESRTPDRQLPDRESFSNPRPPPENKPQTFEEKLARALEDQDRSQVRRVPSQNNKAPLVKDIDLDKIPTELLKELNEKLKALSDAEKQALTEEGRKSLDRKQGEIFEKENRARFELKEDPKTGLKTAHTKETPEPERVEKLKEEIAEFEKELEQEAIAARTAEEEAVRQKTVREIQEALLKRELIKNGFTEQEVGLFNKYRELEGAMKGRIHAFLRALEEYLPKKETTTYEGEHYTGTKLNEKAVLTRAPLQDYRVFSRRHPTQSDEPRMFVTLLIDNSGSMDGVKMQESLKTAIFWARVLRELQIPFSIKFFGDQVVDIMKFIDDYDDARKRIKPNLIQKADASGCSTNISDPLERTLNEMRTARRTYPDCFGAVFVISDSGANQGKTGAGLKSLIEKIQREFLVMNLILSTTKEEITQAHQYFGEKNVVAPKSFSELPNEAFKTLRVVLDRVLKIYSPQ